MIGTDVHVKLEEISMKINEIEGVVEGSQLFGQNQNKVNDGKLNFFMAKIKSKTIYDII